MKWYPTKTGGSTNPLVMRLRMFLYTWGTMGFKEARRFDKIMRKYV